MDAYLAFYRQQDTAPAMERVYGKRPAQLNREFADYVKLFRVDEAGEKRMEDLLRK